MKAGRAGSSSSSSQATVLHSRRAADSAAAAAADADAAPAEDGSSSSGSAASLFDARYGYAVLGGVDPEAAQQEAGAQQPKLHPSRDFRHGEVYEPTVRAGQGSGGKGLGAVVIGSLSAHILLLAGALRVRW